MFTSSFIRRGVSLTKRKFVFEEVDNRPAEIRKLSETIAPTYSQLPNNHAVTWLSLLLVMIVFMVVVGGMTRLTDSGLSIVEWKPISGILLPLTSEQWQLEFTKYKGIPEFLLVNSDNPNLPSKDSHAFLKSYLLSKIKANVFLNSSFF